MSELRLEDLGELEARAVRRFTYRLLLVLGAAGGVAVGSWWLVGVLFVLFLLGTLWDLLQLGPTEEVQ